MQILPRGNSWKKSWRRVRNSPLSWKDACKIVGLTLTTISIAALASPTTAKGTSIAEAKIQKANLVSSGKQRNYSLFVPEGLTSSTPAPLIVLLHGSGRNGLSQVERWKDLAAREGLIVAGPDATSPLAWRMPIDGPEFLRELVTALSSKYPVDPQRVYLWGHSAGAEFALRMGLLESEYFAAVAIHAGALPPDEYNLIGYATRKIPISVFIGTRDPIFPLPLVRGTVTALNAKGFSTKLNEINGHDHNYYVRANEINRAAWEFLKENKLEKAPRFTEYNTRSSF